LTKKAVKSEKPVITPPFIVLITCSLLIYNDLIHSDFQKKQDLTSSVKILIIIQ